jgi:hypothetical protein
MEIAMFLPKFEQILYQILRRGGAFITIKQPPNIACLNKE